MRIARWLVLLALGILAGCGPTVEVEESLTVYSLEPALSLPPQPGDEQFGKQVVIGKTPVTDPERRAELLTAVQEGIDGAKGQPLLSCLFEPRHGLHHVAKDGTVTDYVLCFKCGEAVVEKNGRRVERMSQTTRRPQKLLNDTLRNAGIKLADGADQGE